MRRFAPLLCWALASCAFQAPEFGRASDVCRDLLEHTEQRITECGLLRTPAQHQHQLDLCEKMVFVKDASAIYSTCFAQIDALACDELPHRVRDNLTPACDQFGALP